jgi:hypothetical protein
MSHFVAGLFNSIPRRKELSLIKVKTSISVVLELKFILSVLDLIASKLPKSGLLADGFFLPLFLNLKKSNNFILFYLFASKWFATYRQGLWLPGKLPIHAALLP